MRPLNDSAVTDTLLFNVIHLVIYRMTTATRTLYPIYGIMSSETQQYIVEEKMINFQKKLIELRDKANLSIQALSEISGVPKSTIFNFGQGRQPVKSVRSSHSNRKRENQQ